MIPEASRGISLRSRVIGTKISSLDPRRRLHSSSPAREVEEPEEPHVEEMSR
jgi:hypothetical protein